MLRMNDKTVGIISVATPFFDLEVATVNLSRTREAFADFRLVGPDFVVVEPEDLRDAIAGLRADRPDAVILQIGTFPDGEAAPRLALAVDVPIVVHALPEPNPRTRISLNSLCGANASTFTLSSMGAPHVAVFDDPDGADLRTSVLAALAVTALRDSRIAVVGGHPQGFFPSAFDELALLSKFGVIVEFFSLDQLRPGETTSRRAAPVEMVDAQGMPMPTEFVSDQERRYQALAELLESRSDIAAWAIRDWPELWGMWPALGWAQDDGHVIGVEGDLQAALTMLLQRAVAGGHQALVDISAFDADMGTLTLWHYGAPTALARDGSQLSHDSDHGQNVQFPLRPGRAMLARIGNYNGEFRLLTIDVEITDEVVSLERAAGLARTLRTDPSTVVRAMLDSGWDHHVVLAYGEMEEAWRSLAKLLDIPRVSL